MILTFKQELIPLVAIDDLQIVKPLLNSLSKARFNYIEIVNRTANSMKAIELACKIDSNIQILAGTITNKEDLTKVINFGVAGIITPGFSETLVKTSQQQNCPIYPGVQTSSEVMKALSMDLSICKFFPAALSGGIPWLNAMKDPYSSIKFIPTGGINKNNYNDYLACPNVCAIGGTFLIPKTLNAHYDWQNLTETLSQYNQH